MTQGGIHHLWLVQQLLAHVTADPYPRAALLPNLPNEVMVALISQTGQGLADQLAALNDPHTPAAAVRTAAAQSPGSEVTDRPTSGGKHRRPCFFCQAHPADLRGLETGMDWCLSCAKSLVLANDPITDYHEFDAGDRYKHLVADHGSGLFTRFRSSDD